MLSSIRQNFNLKFNPIATLETKTHDYSFNTEDYSTLNLKNLVTGLNDASISNADMKDSIANITGTADLSLNASLLRFMTLPTIGANIGLGITIMFWFRSNNSTADARIIEIGNSGTDSIQIKINSSGNVDLVVYTGVSTITIYTNLFTSVSNFNDGYYRHICVSMSPTGTNKYYLNGLLVRTTYGNIYPNNVERVTNIVGKSSGNSNYLNGGISELEIYSSIISDRTVRSNYLSNTRIDNTANMMMRYRFLPEDRLIASDGKTTILNYATGAYDASFGKVIDSSVGFETGKFGVDCMFTSPASSSDNTIGLRLMPFRTPNTSGTNAGYTICFWYRIRGAPYTWPWIFHFNPTNIAANSPGQNVRISASYNIGTTGNPTIFGYNTNYSAFSTALNDYSNGQWHFYYITADYTNNNVRACVDLTYFTSTNPITTPAGVINKNQLFIYNYIGMGNSALNTPANTFGGNIAVDDFRFYNTLLSTTELATIYAKTNKL
jgi:hypothetical protein